MMLKCETTLRRWQPPDEAHYVIVGGRVTLARISDQTLACIHFTNKVTRPKGGYFASNYNYTSLS